MDRPAGRAGSTRPAVAIHRRRKARTRNPVGVRPRPRRGRDDAAAVRGGRRRPRPDGRHRADDVSAHQRQQGPAPVRPARGTGQLARRRGAGQTRCAAAGEGNAEAGHLDDDQEPAHRQGVPRLEPEQRIEDHHRAVLAARTRVSDRRRAAHLGRNRRPQAAASALRRGARARRQGRRPAGAA